MFDIANELFLSIFFASGAGGSSSRSFVIILYPSNQHSSTVFMDGTGSEKRLIITTGAMCDGCVMMVILG